MTTQYAIKFSHGHKEYCLIATVEGHGVQPRFKLALNDGSFSWTADSESGKPEEPASNWEDSVCEALLGQHGFTFRFINDKPPKIALEAKETHSRSLQQLLDAAETHLTTYRDGQAKREQDLITKLTGLLEAKKAKLRELQAQLDKQHELELGDKDEGTTSGSGSERRTPEKEDDASSEGEVYSTVTDKGPKGSAGNSAVAGAPRDTAASLDADAIMGADTQPLEHALTGDADMPDAPAAAGDLDALPAAGPAAAAGANGDDAPAAPAAPEAERPAVEVTERPAALARRRKRPA